MPTHIKVTGQEADPNRPRIIASTNGAQWWALDIEEGLTKEQLQRIAARLVGALRGEGVEVTPVITIPPALAPSFLEALEMEQENSTDLYYDDTPKPDEPETAEYIRCLYSIQAAADGSVPLDANQALAASSVVESWYEVVEDCEERENQVSVLALLRTLDAAGYEISMGPRRADYRIRISQDDEQPFEIYFKGEFLTAARRRSELYGLIREHQGPPVGSQARLQLDGD